MLTLGPLALANPWMLLGLALLPGIWWLLKISPPVPKRVRFPAIRFLLDLNPQEQTPAHTPLWLLILRLLIAALIVFALADPLWHPTPKTIGAGPLLIVTDNGWTSAAHWRDRVATMETLVAEARRSKRPVLIAGTAPTARALELHFESADDAAARLRSMSPLPVAPNRKAVLEPLKEAVKKLGSPVQIVWLSDGLDHGNGKSFAGELLKLSARNGVELVEPKHDELPLALLPPSTEDRSFTATIIRAVPPGETQSPATPTADTRASGTPKGTVRALSADGVVLATASFAFAPQADRTKVRFDLPVELRNRIGRLAITGENSSAAISLIDERWRRRSVTLVSGAPEDKGQSLLSELYYLQRALAPYADIRPRVTPDPAATEIGKIFVNPPSVLALADVGALLPADRQAVESWVESGGVLMRFAGSRFASEENQAQPIEGSLNPVPLRRGGRALDGSMSWSQPQGLAPFEDSSPFAGLAVPDDVTVARQMLAEPSLDPQAQVWARLKDGTPLVTAAKRGKGWLVLFHVTANTEWSNLPLSGLFPEMLRRILALSQESGTSVAQAKTATLAPLLTLDGSGVLGAPPPDAVPVSAGTFDTTLAGPRHPPGLYGSADAPRALNQAYADMRLRLLPELEGIASRHNFAESPEARLRPWVLGIALVLIIADGIAALYVTGLFDAPAIRRRRRRRAALAPVILAAATALLLATPNPAHAQAQTGGIISSQAASETHLAYVITGDAQQDEISRAGLQGLTDIIRIRTAMEAGKPMGVDVARDELAFFPLLYWRLTAAQPALSSATKARIAVYIKNGGMILFDTADQGTGSGSAMLPALMAGLDLPPLGPIPGGHVLGKSFYLLQDFPGRWEGGKLWVESDGGDGASARVNDGVSSVIVGSNDFAAAWARDESGRPLYPCDPGGERQREMANRFGVNLVMYALTGNYKSDQVHVPALLERLGQ